VVGGVEHGRGINEELEAARVVGGDGVGEALEAGDVGEDVAGVWADEDGVGGGGGGVGAGAFEGGPSVRGPGARVSIEEIAGRVVELGAGAGPEDDACGARIGGDRGAIAGEREEGLVEETGDAAAAQIEESHGPLRLHREAKRG